MRLAAGAWLMACLAAPAAGLEVDPLLNLQVLGGQYDFSGSQTSLSGDASALFAPAVRFDEAWALLPSAQASYQGTKQVVDLVGAGTMFQEQMDYRGSARLVWAPEGSPWRLKPSFGYKYELLKETKDERWGAGLFDYQRWNVGLESEYVWRDPYCWRLGVDYYETQFPNYTSLESQAALQFQGQELARELVGSHVLDTRNLAASLALDGPLLERAMLEGALNVTYRHFPRQPVVDDIGALTSTDREDVTTAALLAARLPAELNADLRVTGGLELGYAYNASNQNDYDAVNVRYTGSYYNYSEWRLGPALKVLGPRAHGGRAATLDLSGSWWRRRYPYRTAQDPSGLYDGGTLESTGWTLDAGLRYPMLRRLSLVFQAQYGQASSNQRFEQFYRYNYSVANYLFGVSYEY